jgi:hypothetical protein
MNSDVKLLWFIPINTRSRRRGLVLTFYASEVLGCVFSVLIHTPQPTSRLLWDYVGMVASFFVLTASWLALVRLLREYGFVGDHRLHISRDERQAQVRHAAYVRAYWILMTLVCLTSAVFLSSAALETLRPTLEFVGKPLVPATAIVLAVSLPSAIIAWTEPDLKEVG